jgi:hypothetical protein
MKKDPDFGFSKIFVRRFTSRMLALAEERRLINTLAPEYNIRMKVAHGDNLIEVLGLGKPPPEPMERRF